MLGYVPWYGGDLPAFFPGERIRMPLLKPVAMLLACLFLTGFSLPKKLKAPLPDSEKAAHVVVLLRQSEVGVDDPDVHNIAAGVLGSVVQVAVSSTKTANRQKALAPLRDSLLDFRFEEHLAAAIRAEFPHSLAKVNAPLKIVRNDEEWRAHVGSVMPANVLLVEVVYQFEQDFQIAYVWASVDLSTHNNLPPTRLQRMKLDIEDYRALKPLPLHRGTYFSQFGTARAERNVKKIGELPRYRQNAMEWNADRAAMARTAFIRGAAEVAALIRRDAEQSVPRPARRSWIPVWIVHHRSQPQKQRVRRIEQAEGRSLVSFSRDLMWIDDRQIRE
jgi:hypothetical protein